MKSPATVRRLRWVARQFVRAASTAAGAYIEYLQVRAGHKASDGLIFLGLWLMAVPPALWLDSLRRASSAVTHVTSQPPPVHMPEDEDPDS